MFRKAIAFMTRRDGIFKRRASRRLNSPRASVFLEYAIVLPLFILVISTMIEFAAFWDAKIMANHTAWTCARIAAVEAGQKPYVESPAPNRLRTQGMKTATTLLMSTCAMGSMHGGSEEWAKHWFEQMIKQPLQKLRDSIVNNLKTSLTKLLKNTIGKFLGEGVVAKFVEEIVGWVADKMLDPIIGRIVQVLDTLFNGMFQWIGDMLGTRRALRQLAYAGTRVKEFPDIITVTERKDAPFVFSKQATILVGESRLDFPRVLDSSSQCDKWFVKSDAPWPPNSQSQRMIDVKIRWPFERAWMFPVLSVQKLSDDDSKSLEGVPTAVGRAMAYPQPIISNENLKSEGATPYDPGKTNAIPDVIKGIVGKYKGFLQVAALYYHYQMKNEEVGPYDSKKKGSYTYKGIGLGVSGGPDKEKYWTPDGLVFWMDRAPEKADDQGAWARKTRPADYYQCWKEVVENGNEKCLFWKGIEFHAFKYAELKRLCNHDYWRKEWFFWNNKVNEAGERHLRALHTAPNTQLTRNFTMMPNAAVNGPCFVMPSEIQGKYAYNVTENEFKAHVPSAEQATVIWKNYQEVMNRDRGLHALDSRVDTMVDVMCSSPNVETIKKDEPDAFNRIRYACEQTNNDAWDVIRNCSKELDDAFGGGKGDPGDPGQFMDFGLTDEEIMKDPTNAAKVIEKKLNELKVKVIEAVKRIDKAEQVLRDIDTQIPNKINGWRSRRQGALADFAVNIARGVLLAGSTDPHAVRGKIHDDLRSSCQSVLDVTKEMTDFTVEWKAALTEYYNAQLELGQILNCKYAKGKIPKRPDDPDPGLPKPDPDPDMPKPSSPQSGSDPDNAGDSWTHREGGWVKDGQKEDI